MKPDSSAFDVSALHLSGGDEGAQPQALSIELADPVLLQALLGLSNDLYWETDAQHRLTTLQGRAAVPDMSNCGVGSTPWELFSPNLAQTNWDRLRHCMDQGLPLREVEVARLLPDGKVQSFLISGQPRLGPPMGVGGYCGVGRDISALRRSEQSFSQQQSLTRELVRRVPGLVFQLRRSPSGWFSFPFASGALIDMFQIELADAQVDAAGVFRRLLPVDYVRSRASLDHSGNTLTPWAQSYRVQLPGAQPRWHEANAVPYREPDGSIIWYGFASDVTDRVETEALMQRAHDQMRSRTNLMDATLSSLSQGVMMISASQRVTYYNQPLLELLQLPDSLLARQPQLAEVVEWQFKHVAWSPDHTKESLRQMAQLDDLGAATCPPRYVRKTGDGRTLEVKTQALDGGGWVRTFADVTDYVDAQSAQQRSELHLRALFDAMPDRVWLTDPRGAFIMCNPPAASAFGLPALALNGGNAAEGPPSASHLPGHLDTDQRALAGRAPVMYEQAMPLVAGGADEGVFEVVKRAVFDPNGEPMGVLGMARDVTERKRAEAQIERLAFYDPLTGLCNRRLFLERLAQALANGSRNHEWGAVCFIDLDNFKDLNDTQGHDQGDLLLQQVSRRLQEAVREQDTVGRLGGDEFVVLLESMGPDGDRAALYANTVGENLLRALTLPYQLLSGPQHNTASIGITLFRDHEDRVEDILKRADLAMYQAKAVGRNTVRFFDPHMQEVVVRRAELERDLRGAVDGNELRLYYQPVVDVAGCTQGFEALVRWQHPLRGLVSPMEFIPVAEQTNLILPIGQWVLRTACARLADWEKDPAKADWTVAVNLSARQLRQADFVATVLTVLQETGVRGSHLKLELTESLLLHDVEDTIAKMTQLARQGIRFSLDDFGTGYSSLSYLKRLPLSVLKIDQSFVRDLLTDPNDAAIARAILQLAQSLDLDVVAEGVETQGQQQLLQVMGCRAFQGYFFGRPAPL